MPLLLWNHRMQDTPVGTIMTAVEDRKGLKIEAELPKDDEFVRGRLIPQLKRRGVRGMSIGYKAQQSHKQGDARVLTKIRLYEASFVNLPMNPQAGVETVKSLSVTEWKDLSDREREARLKTLGLSDDMAKKFVRLDREDRGHKGQREAGVSAGVQAGLSELLAALQTSAKR
jgi:HK97 family phage prohead protease